MRMAMSAFVSQRPLLAVETVTRLGTRSRSVVETALPEFDVLESVADSTGDCRADDTPQDYRTHGKEDQLEQHGVTYPFAGVPPGQVSHGAEASV